MIKWFTEDEQGLQFRKYPAAGEWRTDLSNAPRDVWCIIGFTSPEDGMRIAKTSGDGQWSSSNLGYYPECNITWFAIISLPEAKP